MTHSFSVAIAQSLGLKEAIMIQHLYFWHVRNRENGRNFYDGHFWSYNKVESFRAMFPYLSEREIRYCLEGLEQEGYIKTGNYNQSSFDRTKWYALTEKTLFLCDPAHLTKVQHSSLQFVSSNSQIVSTIPDNKNNTDNNKIDLFKDKSLNKSFVEQNKFCSTEDGINQDKKVPVEPSKKDKKTATLKELRERCEKFIEQFNLTRKSKFRMTDKVFNNFKKVIDSYTPYEILGAIVAAMKEDHHIDSNFKWLTPEYILRESILERYVNIYRESLPKKEGEKPASKMVY